MPPGLDPRKKYPTLWARLMALCVPDPETGCWNWIGARGGRGKRYPRINIWDKEAKRTYCKRAHRVIAELVSGERPYDTVEHTCRNTLCINPNHLGWMTLEENTQSANNQRYGREDNTTVYPLLEPGEENPFAVHGRFYHPSEPVPF